MKVRGKLVGLYSEGVLVSEHVEVVLVHFLALAMPEEEEEQRLLDNDVPFGAQLFLFEDVGIDLLDGKTVIVVGGVPDFLHVVDDVEVEVAHLLLQLEKFVHSLHQLFLRFLLLNQHGDFGKDVLALEVLQLEHLEAVH